MARKTGLGSGVYSLFADNAEDIIIDSRDISVLSVALIEPKKNQPRKDFKKESLAELADSIAKIGIIQPIVVRKLPSGYYQIIAGERRWRAAKMAGLDVVPVVIKNVDDLTAAEMTLIENLQREDLNPIEEAMGYKYLADQYDLTQEEIAKRVAKSRSVVANSMRLLFLPDDVVKYIEDGDITAGHSRYLLSFDEPEDQLKLAQKIVKNGLTIRETEKLAKTMRESSLSGDNNIYENKSEAAKHAEKAKKIEELYLKSLQDKLSVILGKKVIINMKKKNGIQNGKLEIEYKNNEELESIIKILCGGKNIFEN